jgi:hypothetical protein
MKLIDFENVVDEVFGKVGTPVRDAMEKEVADEVKAYTSEKKPCRRSFRRSPRRQNLSEK